MRDSVTRKNARSQTAPTVAIILISMTSGEGTILLRSAPHPFCNHRQLVDGRGGVPTIEAALPVHGNGAAAFCIRHEHGRLAVLIGLSHRVVVFLSDQNVTVLVRDDAVRAVAALLPEFCPLHAGGDNARNVRRRWVPGNPLLSPRIRCGEPAQNEEYRFAFLHFPDASAF